VRVRDHDVGCVVAGDAQLAERLRRGDEEGAVAVRAADLGEARVDDDGALVIADDPEVVVMSTGSSGRS